MYTRLFLRTFFIVIIVGLVFFFFPSNTSADFVTPTLVQKELKIEATVPPHNSDFQLEFSSSAQDAIVGSDESITYTITYGSSLPQSTSLNLEVEWSLGTIPSKNLYAFDIVSYVSESASRGYNEAIPTIDLAKKKISWQIIFLKISKTKPFLLSSRLRHAMLPTTMLNLLWKPGFILPKFLFPKKK